MSVRATVIIFIATAIMAAVVLAITESRPGVMAPEPAPEPRVIRIDPEVAERVVAIEGGTAISPPVPTPRQEHPATGETYVVAVGDRAVLVNRKPVRDGYRKFRRGQDCRIVPGGTMTVLGSRTAGDPPDTWTEYLIRYSPPPTTSDYYVRPRDDGKPYSCPPGAVFYHEDPSFIAEDPS